MSCPIYCHGPIYTVTIPYMAWPLNLLERFIWKVLPVVVWICTQPWPTNSSRTKKIVWGTCVKGFNWPYFRQKANKTVNISLHFKVSSKEWGSDRENPSAQAVLTPKLLGHTQDMCSVRCETQLMLLLCVCRQLWRSFGHESKACSFLVSSRIFESRCFD